MKARTFYVCSACGARSHQWQGQCPQCGEWNTLAEQAAPRVGAGKSAKSKSVPATARAVNRPEPLESVSFEGAASYSSGQEALDRVLGRGLVPGAAVLLAGEPGIGKSTLLLQLVGNLARTGRGALYVSAEESLGQLRGRAERLGLLSPSLTAMATTRAEDVLAVLEDPQRPDLLILDSVQTVASEEVDGLPGSVSQVRAVSTALVELAKRTGTTLVLVGHVTKEGQIAGPKLLEHMVDTVLSLEGDRKHLFRMLRVMKNRFGPAHEILLYQMTGDGMEVVTDPSTFFLYDRDPGLSGASLCMAVSGQRAYAVEVQALAAKTVLAIPRRTALGFDANRLHLLLAVMEKKLRLNLSGVDIYTKIGGGMRLADPALDAGIVAAVLSSFYDRPLPERAVVWGEVDLNGRIRPVTLGEARVRQARQLGYSPLLHPGEVTSIADLQARLFGRG
ncbi:DNA repair protein RadA [Desulfocurvus sp. DL9XJH121]